MTITDPEVIKRIQEQKAKRKAEYDATKGQKPRRYTNVTVCKVCGSHIGTFRKNEHGVMTHLNCPGPRKKPGVLDKIRGSMKIS